MSAMVACRLQHGPCQNKTHDISKVYREVSVFDAMPAHYVEAQRPARAPTSCGFLGPVPTRRFACYTRRMNNPNFIDDIAARIRGLIDQGPAADFDKNVRTLLAGFFNRLDLVTREEYDVQREVLLRTREKLAQLEAKVAELERRQQQ